MHPWPLTPLKKKEEHVKTILDIELSEEEEEDDDYNPEKEKEVSPLPAGRSVDIRVGILDKSKSQ